MKIDLVIATYNRANQLRETLKNVYQFAADLNTIYVINNNSTDNTKKVVEEFENEKLISVDNEINLGAAGGKNVGLRLSKADVIIVIDDDAVFCSDDPVGNVRHLFEQDDALGLIQFKIINERTNKILRHEFPGDDPEAHGDNTFDIGYFIGAGHAIRKSMLESVGYYPDDFGLYAHEEIDLSYRAVNGGYKMRYAPSIAVLHKKDPSGRLPSRAVAYNLYYYRLIMTWKYLPAPYSFVNNFLWFVKTAVDGKSLFLALSVYFDYLRNKRAISREVLTADALDYMRRNNGRLFR